MNIIQNLHLIPHWGAEAHPSIEESATGNSFLQEVLQVVAKIRLGVGMAQW